MKTFPLSIQSLEEQIKLLKIENMRLKADYSGLTKDQIEDQNIFDIKEMAQWYGGFDELREVIARVEENENEAAFERSQNDY